MLIEKVLNRTPSPTSLFSESLATTTPPSNGVVSSVAAVSAPMTPHALKSILKVRDNAHRVTRSKSLGNAKKVSFSDNLTTVKKFDLAAEPISVSRDSPDMSPFLIPLDYSHQDGDHNVAQLLDFDYDEEDDTYVDDRLATESYWFNDVDALPQIRGLVSLNGISNGKNSDSSTSKSSRRHKNGYDFARTLEALNMDLYDESEDDILELSPQRMASPSDYRTLLNKFIPLDSSSSPLPMSTSRAVDTGVGSSINSPSRLRSGKNKNDRKEYDLDDDPNYFKDWDLVFTNLSGTATFPNENDILHDFLQGQNIRLRSITQLPFERNKLIGLLVVDNISYEKFIEIKFTFNNWNNINYLNAFFDRSLTDRYDQFKFILNLDSFKVFLKVKGLINGFNDMLNIEFCCSYNVRNETYYDNNHSQNYKLTLRKRHHEQDLLVIPKESNTTATTRSPLKAIASNSLHSPKTTTDAAKATDVLVDNQQAKSSADSTAAPPVPSRIFNDDTDYFNTSPLKHLYHNSDYYYPDIWRKPVADTADAPRLSKSKSPAAASASTGTPTAKSSVVTPASPQSPPYKLLEQSQTVPPPALASPPLSPSPERNISTFPADLPRLSATVSTGHDGHYNLAGSLASGNSNFETRSIATSSSDVSLSSNMSTDSTDSTLSSFQHDNEAASTIKKQNDFDYYAKFYARAQPGNDYYLNLGDLDDHFYFWDTPAPANLNIEKLNNISRDTIQAIKHGDQEGAEVETNDDQSNQTDSTLKNTNVCTTPGAASGAKDSNDTHNEILPNPTTKNIFDSSATNLDYQALLSSYCFYTPSRSGTPGGDENENTDGRDTFNRLAYITSLLD